MCSDNLHLRVSGSQTRPSLRSLDSFRNAINALSFSYDGEYLAIANTGPYIDIVRTQFLAIYLLLTWSGPIVCNRDECPIASCSCIGTVTYSDVASLEICICLLWANKAPGGRASSCGCHQPIRRRDLTGELWNYYHSCR